MSDERLDDVIDNLFNQVTALKADVQQLRGDRRKLDIAVQGLRELETKFDDMRRQACEWIDDSGEHVAQTWELAGNDVSALLAWIEAAS